MPSDLTFSAWVNTTGDDSVSSYAGNAAMNIIGDRRLAVTIGFGIHNGVVRYNQHVLANGNAWHHVNGNTPVNDGLWHHICVTHANSGQIYIYVDGMVDAVGNIPNNQGYGNNSMNTIGAGYGSLDHYGGLLSDVAGFRRALSQSEIRAMMLAGLTGNESDLFFWYPMDQGVCAGANTGVWALTDHGPYSRDGILGYFSLNGCTSNWICSGPTCNYLQPQPIISAAVPTLSWWAIMILGLLILCIGAIALKTRRVQIERMI